MIEVINNIKCHSKAYRTQTGNEYKYWFECHYCGNGYATTRGNVRKSKLVPSCGCMKNTFISKSSKGRVPTNKIDDRQASINIVHRSYAASASHRGYEFMLTIDDVTNIIFKDCFYCGQPPERTVTIGQAPWKREGVMVNGIDRYINSNGYAMGNVVSCCSECNYFKGSRDGDDFIELCKKITDKNGRWIGEIR